jgi:carbamoylphosphate synthase large subunit
MNVLLTSVGRRSYLVKYFKDALGNKGQVHVSNSTELSPAFAVADKSVVTPLIYDEEYIPFLISYCKKNEIRVLISLFDVDLPILSKNIKLFESIGVKVIVSDKEVINICNDKLLTYRFLIENGFNAPNTYCSLEETEKRIKYGEIKYPVIIKPRWGMGSIGVFQADNNEELKVLYRKTLSQIKNSYLKYESNKDLNESVIIQEKLVGQEFGLDVINDLNKVHQNTVVKIKYAMRSGETDCAQTVYNEILKELGVTLSQKLGHIGNLDVDVFVANDKPYILEMNARFGGGYPFSHIAGVNLPKAIINWIQNKEVPESLLKEKYGVLAHKDINIMQIDYNK